MRENSIPIYFKTTKSKLVLNWNFANVTSISMDTKDNKLSYFHSPLRKKANLNKENTQEGN